MSLTENILKLALNLIETEVKPSQQFKGPRMKQSTIDTMVKGLGLKNKDNGTFHL